MASSAQYVILAAVVALGGVAGFRGLASAVEDRAGVHGDRILAMQGAPASGAEVSKGGSSSPGGSALASKAQPVGYDLAAAPAPAPPVTVAPAPLAIKKADDAFSDFFGTRRKKGKDFWVAEAGGKTVAFGFTAGAAIDSDGATNVGRVRTPTTKYVDVHYQAGTTIKFAHTVPVLDKAGKPVIKDGQPVTKQVNKAIPADLIPYVALPPGIYMARNANGQHIPGTGPMGAVQVRPGDFVRVTYNGKTVYAIFADGGPQNEVGEISMYLAEALGMSDNPNSGGTEAQAVTYDVLPGSGPAVPVAGKVDTFHEAIPAMTAEEIQTQARKAFDDAALKGWMPKKP